jgi:hypothetical protein
MNHIAIMKKSWHLTEKILSGEKKIESRWYKFKRSPWNKIKKGDIVYFKNSGEPVTVKAFVSKIIQIRIKDKEESRQICLKYGKQICLVNLNPDTWETIPNYCILIFLKNPKKIKPFEINKKGFGMMSAWITLKDINKIRIKWTTLHNH